MKQFDIPTRYKSRLIAPLKVRRNALDRMKKDHSPTVLDFGPLRITLARHFGFCYGVENAIEISHRALEENEGKRIFLLSQMIHNPVVNQDLEDRGMRFIQDTYGKQLIEWSELKPEDVVIVPAFGTTIEIEERLSKMGIEIQRYNTTCPFVEKVWKRSAKLGGDGYTIVIHGKAAHEETRATFSRAVQNSPAIILRDMSEAEVLADFMKGDRDLKDFDSFFLGKTSADFNPAKDLQRIGVVNQTTMLASDTQSIAEFLKDTVINLRGGDSFKNYFADTRDTLCYATNDNQTATQELLDTKADLAIVVGGYNSSNTSHLVDLCAEKLDTYFVNGADSFNREVIHHFDYHGKHHLETKDWLPNAKPLNILLTSGASCPDASVEEVIDKLCSFFAEVYPAEDVLEKTLQALA